MLQQAMQLLEACRSVTLTTVHHATGFPESRIVDVMMIRPEGIYFLTARGKPMYAQMRLNQHVAVCGMDARYRSIRIRGTVREVPGHATVDEIISLHPGIGSLYPPHARGILVAWCLYRGSGQVFDLSQEPPERTRFSFGGDPPAVFPLLITEACTLCGECLAACPVHAVSVSEHQVAIEERCCLECGLCIEICPEGAILLALQ